MQIAYYNVQVNGIEYTPNVYRGEHNLISIEINISSYGCADSAKLILGGAASFSASMGDSVTIQLGDESEKLVVFDGIISSIHFCGTHVIVNICKEEMKLYRIYKNADFSNASSGDIVKDIIGSAGISVGNVEDGLQFSHYVVGDKISGLDHIRNLAQKNDFFYYVDVDKSFIFAKPKPCSAKKIFTYGENILEIYHTSKVIPFDSVYVHSEAPAMSLGDSNKAFWLSKQAFKKTAIAGQDSATYSIQDSSIRDAVAANRMTKNLADTYARKKLLGNIQTLGAATVFPGDCLTIQNSPISILNSTFMVTHVQHLFNRLDGFISYFDFMGCLP